VLMVSWARVAVYGGRALAGVGAGAVVVAGAASLADEGDGAGEADAVAGGGREKVAACGGFRALPPRLGVYLVLGLCLRSQSRVPTRASR